MTQTDKATEVKAEPRDQAEVSVGQARPPDDSSEAAEAVEAAVDAAIDARTSRPREFSFLHKDIETFDTVENGKKTYHVPAQAGSTYWAIVKVGYMFLDERIYCDKLTEEVSLLMADRDEDAWTAYCNKTHTRVYRKLDKSVTLKPIRPWQDRIIGNAKTLTRIGGSSDYGRRLVERGHCWQFYYDEKGRPYFTLHSNLEPLKKADDRAED